MPSEYTEEMSERYERYQEPENINGWLDWRDSGDRGGALIDQLQSAIEARDAEQLAYITSAVHDRPISHREWYYDVSTFVPEDEERAVHIIHSKLAELKDLESKPQVESGIKDVAEKCWEDMLDVIAHYKSDRGISMNEKVIKPKEKEPDARTGDQDQAVKADPPNMLWKKDYFAEAPLGTGEAILTREIMAIAADKDFSALKDIIGQYENSDWVTNDWEFGKNPMMMDSELDWRIYQISNLMTQNGDAEKGSASAETWQDVERLVMEYEKQVGRDLNWHQWIRYDDKYPDVKESSIRNELLEAAEDRHYSRMFHCIELCQAGNFTSPTVNEILPHFQEIKDVLKEGYYLDDTLELTKNQAQRVDEMFEVIKNRISEVDSVHFDFVTPEGQELKHYNRHLAGESFGQALKQAAGDRGQAVGFGHYRGYELSVEIPPNARNSYNVMISRDGEKMRPQNLQDQTFEAKKFTTGQFLNDISRAIDQEALHKNSQDQREADKPSPRMKF